MNKLSAMPDDGQFVAVWKNEGVVFSQTFLHDDGDLLAYDFMRDDWVVEHGYTEHALSEMGAVFFQVEGE